MFITRILYKISVEIFILKIEYLHNYLIYLYVLLFRRHIQNYTQQLARDTSPLLKELMKSSGPAVNKLARDRLSEEYMTTLNAFQVSY